MKILISGFTPFDKEKINPSWEAVKLLNDKILNADIYKIEVDTSFNKSFKELKEKIDTVNPDVILMVGQAGGRKTITMEKVAINLMDCRIPDNDGDMYEDTRIVNEGPDAYFTNIDIHGIKKELAKENIEVNVSYTAGTFVCNYLMYNTLHYVKDKNIRADFIHVPFADIQVKDNKYYFMTIKEMAYQLTKIIEIISKK